jgi:acetyl esterase/lipase
MRPYAHRDIDPSWVRRNMGRPRGARRFMARSTGAVSEALPPQQQWPGGEVVRWPAARPDAPVVLYLHGGGFIACSPETHRSLVGSIVRRLGGSAYVPAYRLAPEHPFPAALTDARAAYEFLLHEVGVIPSRLIIAGDSAGGGLALALALSLRDAGVPLPAAIVAFSPWTDLASTGVSLDENSERCAMFAGETIRRAARFYAGDADPTQPLLSPLYGDYRGMPPILVHASDDEVLRDDGVRVAERARAAGVDVELRLWHHLPHVWQFFAAVLPEARESLDAMAAFVRRHVRG